MIAEEEEALVLAPEFLPWPKIARLNREAVITEKIDGTNAAIIVTDAPYGYGDGEVVGPGIVVNLDAEEGGWCPVLVAAQSRKRVISPEDDNFGFARWVRESARQLAEGLGEGYHFGEWYGSGIQRGYGLAKGEKRFMLFNVTRWDEHRDDLPEGVEVATVLHRGTFSTSTVNDAVALLRSEGSIHVLDFDRPEGVVVYHIAANHLYKVLLEGDELPKGLAA